MESLWAEEERKAGVSEARGWDLEHPVRGEEGRRGLGACKKNPRKVVCVIEWTLRPGCLCSNPSAITAG